MKIAASTPNDGTHLLTEDGVDLTDVPNDESVPTRLLSTSGDGPPQLRATQDVRNIIARNPYFEDPADVDLQALLQAAEVQGAPADEIGEVPEDIAERIVDAPESDE
jgi:hypothetical protein